MTNKIMPTRETMQAIRFGYGLPGPAGPKVKMQMPDRDQILSTINAFRDLKKQADRGASDVERKARRAREKLIQLIGRQTKNHIARSVSPQDDFEERLATFWFDHFSIEITKFEASPFIQSYIEEAIRPNVMGHFSDLLAAAITHPAMVLYLDQGTSMGPNSFVANLRKQRGLNENLAREVLELHTLGVEAAYTQSDVRELAELFTGLSMDRHTFDFQFRPALAEPGRETILGQSYGGARLARLEEVTPVFEDLAAHPSTARHLARKLAIHFVADDPSEELVGDLETSYHENDGLLGAVYSVLRAHPEAKNRFGAKAKQPYDFIISSLRALGVSGQDILKAELKDLKSILLDPMHAMGQPWRQPGGPDGWPEAFDAWISPQGMATRISWAMEAPKAMGLASQEPEVILERALGEIASERVRWAVPKAETRQQGIGLVLASAEFNRR
ncbi:MAG: DUF1800 domain-containing protein [Pseudomonadota bacterium]